VKKVVAVMLGVMFMWTLAACEEFDINDDIVELVFGTDYEVENFRTEPLVGYPEEGIEEIFWIESLSELETYVKEYEDIFNFDWDDPSFREHIEQYDEDFFAENHLFFVVVDEPSGSIRHGVEEITAEEDVLNIHMSRDIPDVGTWDMAAWHVVIELDKDAHDFDSVELILE